MTNFWMDLRGPKTVARRQEAVARERKALREKEAKKAHWGGRETLPRASVTNGLEQRFASSEGPVYVLLPPHEISTHTEHGFTVVVVRRSDWKRGSALVFVGEGSSLSAHPPTDWFDTGVASAGEVAAYDAELSALHALLDDDPPTNREGLDDDVLTDPFEELDRLGDLYEKDLLTEAEYTSKVKETLDRV